MSFVDAFSNSFKSLSVLDVVLMTTLIVLVLGLITYLFAFNRIENVESFSNETDDSSKLSGASVSGKIGGDPIDLDTTKPIDNMTKDDICYVLIYDNQCPHCVKFKPTWKNIANKYNGSEINSKKVSFYQAGEEQNATRSRLENKYGVQGYPTVLILKSDGTNVSATEYNGDREFSYMSSYIEQFS